MERYFAFKISFLIFWRLKKFSPESFLTFRELQPLVSYKRVSYKKIRVVDNFFLGYAVVNSEEGRGGECNFHLKFIQNMFMKLFMTRDI